MKSSIQYIKHQNINKSKWDNCINDAKNGNVFAYSWYLDCVFSGWDALILNDYEAVFPLPIKSKFGLKYMLNPMFALQLGLFNRMEMQNDILIDFIQKIPKNIRLIDYNLNSSNKIKSIQDYSISSKKCQMIDLNYSYEEIKKNYSTNLKRNIVKAKKNNLTILSSDNVSNVISIFKENRGNSLHEIKDIHYSQLEKLLKTAFQKNVCFIYEVWVEQELIASAAYTFTNNQIIYIKGGSTQKGRDLNAMHLIMDYVIEKYSSQKILFDFGGSSIDKVANFNKQFGAKDYTYQNIYRNNLPFPLNLLKK